MKTEPKFSNKEHSSPLVPSSPHSPALPLASLQEGGPNVSLERQSNLIRSLYLILAYLIFEVAKQLTTYSLTTLNQDVFPVPPPLLVVAIELCKLNIIFIWAQVSGSSLSNMNIGGGNLKFGIPAICYFITNLMYLHALTITSPPIWIILIQTRTLYTALAYKMAFGKDVTWQQLIGCVLIVLSIPIIRLSELHGGRITISFQLFLLSQLAAVLSSVACLAVEVLLKNDRHTFLEQQMWLYIWGAALGTVALGVSFSPLNIMESVQRVFSQGQMATFLCLAIVTSSASGLCVPRIVKNLDSIVKDYLAAANNVIIALFTAVLFPSHFPINALYGASLLILAMGVTLYEKKNCCYQNNVHKSITSN